MKYNAIAGFVRRAEEGEALNMIPMEMGKENMIGSRGSINGKRVGIIPYSGTRIAQDNLLLVCFDLHAGSVGTVGPSEAVGQLIDKGRHLIWIIKGLLARGP